MIVTHFNPNLPVTVLTDASRQHGLGFAMGRYAAQLKAVFDHLSVDGELVYLDAKRIVIPLKGVKSILKLLQGFHVGVNKTYNLARLLYYWPGMLNDIKQLIEGCEACSKSRPSQPKNIRSTDPPSSTLGPPLSHVGLDMFEFGGNQHIFFYNCPVFWELRRHKH